MWRKEDYLGNEVTWYSEEEYRVLEKKLDLMDKILYNINQAIKDESLEENGMWLVIEKELKMWKRNSSVKNAD